ncbi:MAG TPA: hypothetical protein DCQ20_08920 [Nitrospira sp.]|nr:hypothetical protein [Nitrospira sp.]
MSFLTSLLPSLVGSQLGGPISAYYGQQEQNAANAQQAQKQMDFQERMSSTAWQRGTADMAAAGLNPMLAFSQGGASSPGGSMATMGSPTLAGLSGAKQSAETQGELMQLAQGKANIDQVKAQTEKIKADTVDQRIVTARALADLGTAEWHESGGNYRRLSDKEKARRAAAEADSAEVERDVNRVSFSADSAKRAADSRRADAEATLSRLGISEAKAGSDFYGSDVGSKTPWVDGLIKIIRGVSSARRASR